MARTKFFCCARQIIEVDGIESIRFLLSAFPSGTDMLYSRRLAQTSAVHPLALA